MLCGEKTPGSVRTGRSIMACLVLGAAAVASMPYATSHAARSAAKATIKVGDKGFTEEYLVADMYELLLRKAGFPVSRHSYTSTAVAQSAIRRGDIQLYPEYTGTGYATVLGMTKPNGNPIQVYGIVKNAYQKRFKLTWLTQAPMNNSQGIAVTRATAQRYKIRTLSDLGKASGNLSAVVLAECVGREDCLLGLKRVYGVNFKSVRRTTSPALNYKALLGGQADVSEVFTTDGQIAAYNLVVPTDNKKLFPPYHIAPVVRNDTLRAQPQIRNVLNRLAPYLTSQALQKLNAKVDLKKQDHMAVARAFLRSKHLL